MDKQFNKNLHQKKYEHNRIAVLGAEVNEAYQSELWRGITEEAARYSKKLICFLGSRVGSSFPEEQTINPLYRLAHSGNFDGIIIISSAISTYLDPAQVQYLFDARPLVPKISIGLQIKGVGSVCVDSRDAMKQITEHLIFKHQRKNFALIAGPRWHPESEQRRKTIFEVLESNGLPLDDDMLIHGTFEYISGRNAMMQLLRQGKPVDAVLCLNDQMAIGAIEELSERGISVPDMISVCGFDGIEESEYCSPPLTTVIQPLYQLGVTAVRELYCLMGGQPPRDITLTCQPMIRQSCSCGSEIVTSGWVPLDSNTSSSETNGADCSFEEKLDDLVPERGAKNFLECFDRIVTSSIFNPGNFSLIDEKLSTIENSLPEPFSIWFPALRSARQILWETKNRYLINLRIQKKHRSDTLRSVVTSLSGVFELPELFQHLAEGLMRLGFNHGYMVMYSMAENSNIPIFKLVFRLKNGIYNPIRIIQFDNSEVLPDINEDLDTDDCMTWMFTPLVFQRQAIGHILLPGTYPDTEIYETLTKQIASSLQGALLLEQVKTHEQSLMVEVDRRTQELTDLNRDLRAEVATRIRLEKEVIDISKHTMERIGQDLHDDLCQHLAGVSLHVSALRFRVEENNPEVLTTIDFINKLLSDSIGRTKRIVRGLLPLGIAEDGVSTALEILCQEMSESSGLKIEFNGNTNLSLLAPERAIELYRILQEALNNSLKHSGASLISVKLGAGITENEMHFFAEVQDNGIGFSPDAKAVGMGLKIMRYRGERSDIHVDVQNSNPGIRVLCEGIQRFENV